MARLNEPFNPNDHEPGRAPIEASPEFVGWHPMQFCESEMIQTKAGDGEYLQLVAQVIGGDFKGRKLWVRLNLVNKSSTAMEIAKSELTSICLACGKTGQLFDSEQLHLVPFEGHVRYVPPDGAYKAKNEVDGYRPLQGTPAAAAQAPAPAAAKATPADDAPPWKRAS